MIRKLLLLRMKSGHYRLYSRKKDPKTVSVSSAAALCAQCSYNALIDVIREQRNGVGPQ
jgi:hypothetical protein